MIWKSTNSSRPSGKNRTSAALEHISGLDFSSRREPHETDQLTFATGREGVFAGGDLQTGPAQAIMAIAAGREAACSIERFLDGEDMAAGRNTLAPGKPRIPPHIQRHDPLAPRKPMPELPLSLIASGNFREVELGYR